MVADMVAHCSFDGGLVLAGLILFPGILTQTA